jgi:hypothetical protein
MMDKLVCSKLALVSFEGLWNIPTMSRLRRCCCGGFEALVVSVRCFRAHEASETNTRSIDEIRREQRLKRVLGKLTLESFGLREESNRVCQTGSKTWRLRSIAKTALGELKAQIQRESPFESQNSCWHPYHYNTKLLAWK